MALAFPDRNLVIEYEGSEFIEGILVDVDMFTFLHGMQEC
jgi:hypothetical protein